MLELDIGIIFSYGIRQLESARASGNEITSLVMVGD